MRLTKIYTKVGDKGQTMLVGGVKVPKDSIRIETYGTVDELNSFLGLLRDTLRETDQEMFKPLIDRLFVVQNEMYDLGGELATPLARLDTSKQQIVTKDSIARLERELDEMNEALPPLANFVLPGGHRANSTAHVCRTICRRAERLIVGLGKAEEIREEPRIYLNRLSDWLFVVTRDISHRLGCEEVLWHQKGKDI